MQAVKNDSRNGWWRSLVAHLTGGQGVASSNLVHPTRNFGVALVATPFVMAFCGVPYPTNTATGWVFAPSDRLSIADINAEDYQLEKAREKN